MNRKRSRQAVRLGATFNPAPLRASLAAAVALLLNGCATANEYSFNDQFGEHLPTDPKYYIKDEDDAHFIIVAHQGSPATGAERIMDVKEAATKVAAAEAQRLGWQKWDLNYIQERDQGWMHRVVAKVTHE